MTRVRTNVAAKVQEEAPAPDFSREQPQTYIGAPVTLTMDARTWEGRVRRLSAPFAEDPLIFHGNVSLTARGHQPLLHQQRGLAARHRRRAATACSSRP